MKSDSETICNTGEWIYIRKSLQTVYGLKSGESAVRVYKRLAGKATMALNTQKFTKKILNLQGINKIYYLNILFLDTGEFASMWLYAQI